MSASTPSIGVVVAVYNGAPLVGDAIQSVLRQTRPPHEVCVVDDGSTDGTSGVVAGFAGVRCLRLERNGGQAAALNLGVASTSAGLIAFLDADDVWEPDKLDRQCRALDENPAIDVVYGLMREQVAGGVRRLPTARGGVVRPAHLPSAMLIRRDAFAKVGGFDARFRLGSVVDWYARAREAGLVEHVVPAVVYQRRIHGNNVGLTEARHRGDYLRVIKAALDRRRRAQNGTGPANDDER